MYICICIYSLISKFIVDLTVGGPQRQREGGQGRDRRAEGADGFQGDGAGFMGGQGDEVCKGHARAEVGELWPFHSRFSHECGVGALWDCVPRVRGGGGGCAGDGVPLGAVPVLSWCGEVSLGGKQSSEWA